MLSIGWDFQGIVYWEVLPRHSTIDVKFYRQQLENLKAALQISRPERRKVRLLNDNTSRDVSQSLRQGGRRPPISQDLEAGGRNMFVRMDLSLKYSQKRNFFHFFEQKNKIFESWGIVALPLFTPLNTGVHTAKVTRQKLEIHQSWLPPIIICSFRSAIT